MRSTVGGPLPGAHESSLGVSLALCSEGLVWEQKSASGLAFGSIERGPVPRCGDSMVAARSLGGSLSRQYWLWTIAEKDLNQVPDGSGLRTGTKVHRPVSRGTNGHVSQQIPRWAALPPDLSWRFMMPS